MSVLASLFMRNALPTHDTSRCTTTTCVSILKYLQAFFAFEMGRSAQELFAIEKMAAQGMRIQQITEAVFRVAQRWQIASSRSKTQRKNTSFDASFTAPWHSPQTKRATQTRTTPTFPRWALPDPQMGPGAHHSFPKILNWALKLRKFCFERPHVVEAQCENEEGPILRRKVQFLQCALVLKDA